MLNDSKKWLWLLLVITLIITAIFFLRIDQIMNWLSPSVVVPLFVQQTTRVVSPKAETFGGQIFEQAQNPVENQIPETNPFEVKTNPFEDIYVNPFNN